MPCCRFYKYSRPAISQCVKANCTPLEAPLLPFSQQGGIPESVRIESARCGLYVVPCGNSSSPCLNNPGERCLTTSKAPVSNQTLPASEYVAQLRTQTIQAATDPTNPATRFEQYFRPLPPQPDDLVVGPERLPNKDPVRPDPPCVGFGRFAGSSPGVN